MEGVRPPPAGRDLVVAVCEEGPGAILLAAAKDDTAELVRACSKFGDWDSLEGVLSDARRLQLHFVRPRELLEAGREVEPRGGLLVARVVRRALRVERVLVRGGRRAVRDAQVAEGERLRSSLQTQRTTVLKLEGEKRDLLGELMALNRELEALQDGAGVVELERARAEAVTTEARGEAAEAALDHVCRQGDCLGDDDYILE